MSVGDLLKKLAQNTVPVEADRYSEDDGCEPIPEWVPAGHPHEWTAEQTNLYDARMDELSTEFWKEIDDLVYTRLCHCDPECSFGPGQMQEDIVTTEFEVTLGDWSFDPKKPFNPEAVIPPGDPDHWTQAQWNMLSDRMETLPDALAALVDEAMWDRFATTTEDGDKVKAAKTTTTSTGTEVPVGTPKDQLPDNIEELWDEDKKEKGWAGWLLPDKPCSDPSGPSKTCGGPGSDPKLVTKQYKTHMQSCPWWPGFGDPKAKHTSASYAPSCKHDRDLFKLENGLSIYASAYRDVEYTQDEKVNIGVYMYSSWKDSGSKSAAITHTDGIELPFWKPEETKARVTEGIYLNWPDFGLPDKQVPVKELVAWMLEQLAAGKTMEVGCMGGHGRTGTLLSMLLCAQGVTPPEAIERVRKEHCTKAVENSKQAEYIGAFYKTFHGNDVWRKSKALRKKFNRVVNDDHKNSAWTSSKPTGYIGGMSTAPTATGKWDQALQMWTCHTYLGGYKWDSILKMYTKPGKEVTT